MAGCTGAPPVWPRVSGVGSSRFGRAPFRAEEACSAWPAHWARLSVKCHPDYREKGIFQSTRRYADALDSDCTYNASAAPIVDADAEAYKPGSDAYKCQDAQDRIKPFRRRLNAPQKFPREPRNCAVEPYAFWRVYVRYLCQCASDLQVPNAALLFARYREHAYNLRTSRLCVRLDERGHDVTGTGAPGKLSIWHEAG